MYNRHVQMLSWTEGIENQGVNYSLEQIWRLKNGGNKKWLNSLPIFEYAYVLCTFTAMRLGGKWQPYLDDLYNTRMAPIVDRYYKNLMKYRFRRGIFMRNYDSMRKEISGIGIVEETEKMKNYTRLTRKAIRGVCEDYEYEKMHSGSRRPDTEETMPEWYI